MTISVLVADDSPTIRRRAQTRLTEAGFEVHCVEDGEAAWSELEGGRQPDVLLCDILMPKLDGYELCRRVKEDERWKSLPVLLLRGTFEPWDEERAVEAGADGFITKPFETESLVGTVREILESGGAAAAAEPAADSGAADDPEPEESAAEGDATVLLPAGAEDGETTEVEAAAQPERPEAEALNDDDESPFSGDAATDDEPPLEAGDEGVEAMEEAEPEPEPVTAPPTASPVEPAIGAGAATTDSGDDPFGSADDPLSLGDEAPSAPTPASGGSVDLGGLDEATLDALARRVAQHLSREIVEQVAWDVVPDTAEALIRKRMIEIEAKLQGS